MSAVPATVPQFDMLKPRSFDLLCLTTLVVLAAHASHLPIWLSACLILVLALRWWDQRRHPGSWANWIKLPLLGLLLAAVIGVYGNLFGRDPGSALAAGLLVLKLSESKAARDARVAAAFACFLLMAALLFGQSLLATVTVAIGLLPALSTWRSLEPSHTTPSIPRQMLPTLGMLASAIPLALLAFLLIPRLGTPLWGSGSQSAAVTGLTDEMSPSKFTDLLTDDSPAMRVSFDGPVPDKSQRYFRVFVLPDYDGVSWTHRQFSPPGVLPAQAQSTISYQISLEPTHQRDLPMLDLPIEAPAQAHLNSDGEARADKPVDDVRNYTGRSALRYVLQPSLTPSERLRALDLPPGFDPRTHALAAQWRREFGQNDPAIIHAALQLLHDGGFTYTLNAPPLGRDAVDQLLFETRQGFCEHFSSAFTVLMRAAGIPARVVTGYQGGFWSPSGNYLLIRNSDAHAWSEVWLAGRGWVRVDPTAMVRPQRINLGAADSGGDQLLPWYQTGTFEAFRNHWDIVNQWWNQAVIGFDTARQRGLLTSFGIGEVDTALLSELLAASVSLFGLIGLAWALWRRPELSPELAALRQLERKLARIGLARAGSEGPRHYFRRVMRALPAQRVPLEQMMRSYLELRYATAEPKPELLRAFRRAVRNFTPRRMV